MSSLAASDLDELEESLKKLRVSYEKYFAGVERIEPLKERDGVKKAILRLLGDNSKNTARRFRLQTINASLVTYEQYWNRVTRQIEEGTFKRDRVRADQILRAAGIEPRNPLAEVLAEIGPEIDDDLQVEDADLVADDEPVAAPARSVATAASAAAVGRPEAGPVAAPAASSVTSRPRPPAARPASPGPAAPAADPEASATVRPSPVPPAPTTGYSADVRQLHQSYVAARRGTGERDPVTLDAFAATLQKQAAAIKSRFSCKEVEFKVALKDGKAILKATPR